MKVKEINKENFNEEVLNSKGVVLVDFYANWCGPCKMLRPILEEVAKDSTVKIVSINIDDAEELASSYHVFSIPCLVLLENGKEINRSVGFRPKEEIEELIGGKK